MINNSLKLKNRKIIFTIFILGFLSVLIFTYKNSPPVTFFQGVVQSIFKVPKEFLYSLGKGVRQDKIEMLSKKVRALQEQVVGYELMKKDNEALKSQFATSGETTQSMVAAKIIGLQGDNTKPHQLIINVGSSDGVRNSMTVIFEKYLVGKVQEVTSNYSVVITPFNPRFQVLAKLPETNANGIVIGQRDLMLFDGILITDTLKKDGIVVTKGEVDKDGIGVVPNIIIGRIDSISKRETAPFQSAQITPLISYEKLTNVFVISKM